MDKRYLPVDGVASARRDAERRHRPSRGVSETDGTRCTSEFRRIHRDGRTLEAVPVGRGPSLVAFLFEREPDASHRPRVTSERTPWCTMSTMKILDVGCGVNKYEGAIGVDYNADTDADVIHDLGQFPYPFADNEFDKIVSFHVIEHVPDVLKLITELYRITKPGGRI